MDCLIRRNLIECQKEILKTFAGHHFLSDTNFNGHCLIKNNIYIPKKVINLVKKWLRNSNIYFTLNNCSFGCVNLNKNADLDKYKYSGYDIGFDSCSEVSFKDRSMLKIVIIFGAVHIIIKIKIS